MSTFLSIIQEYIRLGIPEQIDYKKFYLYSLITHSTAIEGSTVTEIENQLLFDEGITAPGRTLQEQMMNLDLKHAYEIAQEQAKAHTPYSVKMLCDLSACLMEHTGSTYNTPLGTFSSASGDLRLLNVTAGFGGRSYMAFAKVPQALQEFCQWLNNERKQVPATDMLSAYRLSFLAHYRLVTIHPWADGNGRMARLVMNMLQWEYNLIPVKVLKEQKAEYIQALIDTREQDNEDIFVDTMLRIHQHNLSAEIAAFNASMEANDTKDDTKQLTDRQQIILELIREDDTITISEMIQKIQVSEITIKRELSILKKMGVLERIGGRKEGKWLITKHS